MVTPKRVVETTPLVVAQTKHRERVRSRERSGNDQPHDAKRELLTMSQKLGRA